MLADTINLDAFRTEVERPTLLSDYPSAIAVEKGIPVYDGASPPP